MSSDEKLVQCPYDKAHKILKERLAYHLLRCERNHPNTTKVKCPFNVMHIVEKKVLNDHVRDCPSRITFERQAYQPPIETLDLPGHYKLEVEECWDVEPIKSYNGKENAAKNDVLRLIQNVKPSDKKILRCEEHKRLASFAAKKPQK